MTVLSVIQDMAMTIGIERPDAVFGSTEREHQELAALANEIGDRVNHAADWQRVKRLVTLTGDGVSTAFNLPSDYSRMPKKQEIWSSKQTGAVCHVTDHDLWLEMQVREFGTATLSWTIMGGRMHFYPAPADGEVLKYYYLSSLYARTPGTEIVEGFPYTLAFDLSDSTEYGSRKSAFETDEDGFQLDERLLRLGMIWQWKANKGLPYAEDMQNYELHLAQRVMLDAGPGKVRVGAPRLPRGTEMAYPWSITP